MGTVTRGHVGDGESQGETGNRIGCCGPDLATPIGASRLTAPSDRRAVRHPVSVGLGSGYPAHPSDSLIWLFYQYRF